MQRRRSLVRQLRYIPVLVVTRRVAASAPRYSARLRVHNCTIAQLHRGVYLVQGVQLVQCCATCAVLCNLCRVVQGVQSVQSVQVVQSVQSVQGVSSDELQ